MAEVPHNDRNDRTYRVWGLPTGVSIEHSESILREVLNLYAIEPKVHSLGLDPYVFGRNVEVVATVTFFPQTPLALRDGNSWQITKSMIFQNVKMQLSLTIDTHFKGWTPLNTIKDDDAHKIDCIAVSGLSSHPFGSWKQRGGQFMWLRDSLSSNLNGVRVLLYGYDTPLVQSESFQDIDDIGNKLSDFINSIRPRRGESNFKPRPIVFIAHSLGGILVKKATCRMASRHEWDAQCVYGFIFFGVPNQGIRITHWLPMVKNQPNEDLVRNLAPESHYLQRLHEKFCRELELLQNSMMISVYETLKGKTAKEESPGYWTLTGTTEVLVTRDSARDSCPPGMEYHCIPINQNHADLPKFQGPHDCEYRLLSVYLNQVWKEAAGNVQLRFCTIGFTMGELNQPHRRPEEGDEAMIHLAVSKNYVDAVELLLNRGVDIEAKNADLNTPLRSAASKGYVEVVKLLLNRGADIGAKDKYQNTSLHFAALNGHVDVARLLLDRNADIEAKAVNQWTSLHYCAVSKRIESLELLLDRGANIHVKTTDGGSTALHLAAKLGFFSIVQSLLDRKANTEAKDSSGLTPLDYAETYQHSNVINLLKAYKKRR